MGSYCFFTVEHSNARRIFIRGVADVTEPIDDYDKIIEFYNGSIRSNQIPPNPFEAGTVEHELYGELTKEIKDNFEDFGDELVFSHEQEEVCQLLHVNFRIHTQKVIINE